MSPITGIFIPLTPCYSRSCQINKQTCYSPLCPNKRISSLLRLVNTKQTEQDVDREQENPSKDWITSIPNHIRNSINKKELKRQAGIAELLLTEQNYCQDLDILHRIYAIPLLESNIVISNSSRRQRFHRNVFGNYLDITHIHHSFYHQLTCHNRESTFFIGRVGTIIMQHVTNLIEPYIQYASNHVKAIFCMTLEQKHNPLFSKFLQEQNAHKSTRRLGLRHYLSSPTLWIGKLKLLIQAILKNTVDDADQLSLKASLAILHDTLCRMNSSSANLSRAEFRFEEVSSSIYTVTPGSSELELICIPDGCELIREEALWLARSTHPLQPSLCHLFLFSHALILTHPRMIQGRTEYIIVPGSPIPIQLLVLNQPNANTSMIRRLSFASTSMVSTPLYLINNLRRQKSMNSEISNTSTLLPTTTTTQLHRSHTTIHIKRNNTTTTTTTASTPKPSKKPIQFQLKKKILQRLKSNFRWGLKTYEPKATVPPPAISVTRRDSAPAKLTNTGIQRRTLKICHMAFPENAFRLEFLSRADRLIWEDLLREAVLKVQSSLFEYKMVCKTLIISQQVHGDSMGRIRCAYSFMYCDHKIVAVGSQNGVWMGPEDGSRPFELVLPNQDVYQISVLQDKLVVLTQDTKHRCLVAYCLRSILESTTELDWCVVKRSFVICFTVGKIRQQPVIVYLTKRLQKTWLVIIVPSSHSKNHWFKKYRTEHSISIKDPNEIQIINDAVFIRSDRNGIERIDISCTTVMDLFVESYKVFNRPNIGLLSLGFVCDSHWVYAAPLFETVDTKGLVRMRFEAQVHHVALVFPYLVAFSTSVIEIRHIETTELIQAIRGDQIQFISNSTDIIQPLFFAMQNEDRLTTSVYQLQLSSPP
ncbi:hypothetical protein BD770DRAFT_473904 [Pilaira anomala]|nr:hypothetical protein BD770DRAFT_473904 [Pilaira anomala]